MDLEQRLRQLNRIQPNPVSARSSRARILTARPKLTLRGFLAGALQSGSAIALTGALLLIVGGVVSAGQIVRYVAGLDPKTLKVEAEAIDIQIRLTELKYKDVAGSFGRQTLVAAKPPARASVVAPPPIGTGKGSGSELPATTPAQTAATTSIAVVDASSTPSSTPVTVENALDVLSN